MTLGAERSSRLAIPDPPSLWSRADCETLARRVLAMTSLPHAEVELRGWATARTSFALGDSHLALRNEYVALRYSAASAGGSFVSATRNQVDEDGLRALVNDVEDAARKVGGGETPLMGPQDFYPDPPQLSYDTVVRAMTSDTEGQVFRAATDATSAAGLIAAGDIIFELTCRAMMNTAGYWYYEQGSYGEFSLTARTSDGRGSGWAQSGFEDWGRVDTARVISQAVDLAQRSANPVAIEPGRYTVILEPAAVAALAQPIVENWSARNADLGGSVFSKRPLGTNKIGLQMMDARLQMVSDPWDPDRPSSPTWDWWVPSTPRKIVWFENGVLKNLEYNPWYAKEKGREPVLSTTGTRLFATGPTETLEEMIAGTKRGLWINRFSNVTLMNSLSLLLSGVTRDGTFLIEDGKITKAIKNFRFTESPFFVFNQLETAGEPVRASRYIVCPRLKVRDFSFTSLTDAV